MRKLFIAFLLCLLPSLTFAYGTCGTSVNPSTGQPYGCPNTSGQSQWTAATAEYANVNYCVNTCAAYGDTVNIPSTAALDGGKANWSSELLTNKYVTIAGAGIDVTVITNLGINATNKAMIRYTPNATSLAANDGYGGLFKVTGITFENTGFTSYTSSKGIYFYGNNDFSKFYRNLVVGNCKFKYFSVIRPPASHVYDPSWYGLPIMWRRGLWAGVVHNCTFEGYSTVYPGLPETWTTLEKAVAMSDSLVEPEGQSNGSANWNKSASMPLGTVDAVYVEDCLWKYSSGVMDAGNGGSYVMRFSHVEKQAGNTNINEPDSHGNRGYPTGTGGVWFPSATGTGYRGGVFHEVYLNKRDGIRRDSASTGYWTHMSNSRSGFSAIWGNEGYGTNNFGAGHYYDEEIDRSDMRGIKPSHVRLTAGGTQYRCILGHTSSEGNKPPNATYWTTDVYTGLGVYGSNNIWVSEAIYKAQEDRCYDPITTYNFLNKRGDGAYVSWIGGVYYTTPEYWASSFHIKENRDYWLYKGSSFNGTSGVGSGTWDQRPGTCTEGVGYWATDRGSWNGSSGTDGLHNPLNYTGQGILYRCNASNTFVAYYTPYTYPHPLREIGTTPSCDSDHCGLCEGSVACLAVEPENSCYWYNDTCNSDPEECSSSRCDLCATEVACDGAGSPCDWWDSTEQCNSTAEPVCATDTSKCLTLETCEAAWGEGHWYDSACHAELQPSCRVPYYDQCLTEATCIAIGGIWEVETPTSDPQLPTGYDYSGGGWTAVGADSTYQAIDDAIGAPNDDDYIYSTGTNVIRFTYSRSTTITSITSVEVIVRAKMSAGTGKIRPHLRIQNIEAGTGYNYYYSSYVDLTTSYQNYSFSWPDNPANGEDWTTDDLGWVGTYALHAFGVNASEVADGRAEVSQIYIVIYGDIAGCRAPDPDPPTTPGQFSISGGTVSGAVIK